ncbi:hypothetical protein ACLQ3K_00605 [Tsukamurella sp. DT100]|uniref:hypothetical protein n=1 Tax=Tsukamurella sp. DT100 TaxID=3393415 RepID=UPI003CF45C7E
MKVGKLAGIGLVAGMVVLTGCGDRGDEANAKVGPTGVQTGTTVGPNGSTFTFTYTLTPAPVTTTQPPSSASPEQKYPDADWYGATQEVRASNKELANADIKALGTWICDQRASGVSLRDANQQLANYLNTNFPKQLLPWSADSAGVYVTAPLLRNICPRYLK